MYVKDLPTFVDPKISIKYLSWLVRYLNRVAAIEKRIDRLPLVAWVNDVKIRGVFSRAYDRRLELISKIKDLLRCDDLFHGSGLELIHGDDYYVRLKKVFRSGMTAAD